MEISKEANLAEVAGWVSLDEMFDDGKIGRKGTPGVDKKITYLIPREFFVQTDATDDRDCKSSARFTYYFAPQEVKAFENLTISGLLSQLKLQIQLVMHFRLLLFLNITN